MGWAARRNGSAEIAKAFGYRKPVRDTAASRHDARLSALPIAAMLLAVFGLSPASPHSAAYTKTKRRPSGAAA